LEENSFATLICVPKDYQDDVDWLEKHITHSLESDDVLHINFLQTILLTGPGAEHLSLYGDSLRSRMSHVDTWGILEIRNMGNQDDLLPGPYMVVKGKLWQVLRLYDDTQGAFLAPVRKSIEGRFFTKDYCYQVSSKLKYT
jgi:hypothetical protein